MDGVNTSSIISYLSVPLETLRVLGHFCSFLESWRKKTKGKRVQCQRHHLENDVLSFFDPEDVMMAIALASHERGGGSSVPVSELREQMRRELIGKSPLNVIYEFADFEDWLWSALRKQSAMCVAENWEMIEAWLKPKAA